MNSKFKSFMALSLAFFVLSATAMEQTQEAQENQEQASYFGTKSKVALVLLGATGVYVAYKAYTNPEAFKDAYNACTLDNLKAAKDQAAEKTVAFYNSCTTENMKSAAVSAKDALVSNVSSFYKWAKSFVFSKPEALQELLEEASVSVDVFGEIIR
jgi:hypothetical protein